MAPLTRARAAAEAPTLLDALARAPAAAALVVRALEEADDRKALRLAHPQLRDAVGKATTKLMVDCEVTARAPTPRRWPRLEELTIWGPDAAALEALGADYWDNLHALYLFQDQDEPRVFDVRAARALAAALGWMPELRTLKMCSVLLPDVSAAELFRDAGAETTPQLRSLIA
jgi:hypothetical protein